MTAVADQPVAAIAEGIEQESIEQGEQESGLLRNYAVPKMAEIYNHVKDYNPVIKSSLETVETRILQPVVAAGEARIPSEWKDRASAAGDQIDSLVTKSVNQTKTAVNDKVLQPIQNTVTSVNDKVVHPITETVNTRIVSPVRKVQGMSYDEVKGAVSGAASDTALYWKDLRGDFSKKATLRLEEGLNKVTEFSATRGKDILHVDLIAYSRTVIDNASTVAKGKYEPLMELLAKSVERVNETRASLHAYLSEKAAPLTNAVRVELQARLKSAIAAARELSTSSVAFVQQKYASVEEKYIPEKFHATAIKASLPPRAQGAVQFILDSPQLFSEVAEKADVDASKSVLDNMQSLLGAVKAVYYDHAEAGEPAHVLPAEEPIEDEPVAAAAN